jgi:REP element-mobilizing transposase RayT
LCGHDRVSGRNYEHRRRWIEDRLALLCTIFSIELVAYAIMHNHYHVVVRISVGRARRWSNGEVVRRWGALFSVPSDPGEIQIACWRERLASISWFMRCLNEPLARRANKEDECSGRFWEGRFKLQALLDENALFKCMIYVDLNPIRAGMAETPERSDYTSIQARLEGRSSHLVRFNNEHSSATEPLQLSYEEYVEAVDWSGRIFRPNKKGHIPEHSPAVLTRLCVTDRQWSREIKHYGRWYYRAVGSMSALEEYCARLQQRWIKGMAKSRFLPV